MNSTAPALPSGNREATTFGVAAFTLFVATAAVSLRVFTRKVLINHLGFDDYCAVIALLLVFGCDFAVCWMTRYGLGQHVWNIPPEWIPRYLRTFYISIVLYCAALTAIKVTFLAQYYRVFENAGRPTRITFVCVSVIVVLWSISQLLVGIFACNPVEGFWDSKISSVCIPDHPQWEINATGNIITDLMVLVLPIPVLVRLNIPRRQRYTLVGIFSLGIFTVCISCIRIGYLQLYQDFTWVNTECSGWSMGEISSGLTCACLPTLRPLLARYIPWLASPSADSKKSQPDSSGQPSGSRNSKRIRTIDLLYSDNVDLDSPEHDRAASTGGASDTGNLLNAHDDSESVLGLAATRDDLRHEGDAGGSGLSPPPPVPPLPQKDFSWPPRPAARISSQTQVRAPKSDADQGLPRSGMHVRKDVLQTNESIS